jgi:hypothetical protein
MAQTPAPDPQAAKGALPNELQKYLQALVAAAAEGVVRGAVDAKLANRLSQIAETAATSAEQNLRARLNNVLRSGEETLAVMQSRLEDADAATSEVLDRARAAEHKIDELAARVEEGLEKLAEAERVTERLDENLRSRLDTWSLELKSRVDQIIAEGTNSWFSGLEQQVAPYVQRVDERLQTLAAGLELAQIQQDRVKELSRNAAASFEKEMLAFFQRLSANGE